MSIKAEWTNKDALDVSDLISRKDALYQFTVGYDGTRIPEKDIDNFPTLITLREVKKILRDLPSAQKKGEWIDKEVIEDRKDAKIQEWQQARCSVCNKWHTTPYMYYFDDFNYCPNCGADMRGEKDDLHGTI